MTLQRTDAGYGQVTPGTSRRSPEIFIPLAARNENPEFWGWPDLFTEDPSIPGKMDRSGVAMRVEGTVVTVNMMTWPVKRDFRLRSETLRSAGNVGDILKMELSDPSTGFEYDVEIVRQDSRDYERWLHRCVNAVRNSRKRYGYY